jgi:hypothetical protein
MERQTVRWRRIHPDAPETAPPTSSEKGVRLNHADSILPPAHCASIEPAPFPLEFAGSAPGARLFSPVVELGFKHFRDGLAKRRTQRQKIIGKACIAKQARAHAAPDPQDVDLQLLLRVLGAPF